MIKAWAAKGPKQKLERYEYDPGPIGAEEVEIAVENCGICHSDLSVINNEWGISQYPVVPGHEVIGQVVGMGPQAKGVQIGQAVVTVNVPLIGLRCLRLCDQRDACTLSVRC